MTNSELKPCPFCGGKAEIKKKSGNYGYTYGEVAVGCGVCSAQTKEYDTETWNERKGTYSIEEEAVRKAIIEWNHRPIEENLQAEVERLREALEEIDRCAWEGDARENGYDVIREIARQALEGK